MHLAVFQPDIPQNLGAMIRLSACLDAPLHVIEPCGFPFSLKAVRTSALDYGDKAEIHRHDSWTKFLEHRPSGRLALMTTKGSASIWETGFQPDDTILMGRESAGAPAEVHEAADLRIHIPMAHGARSLNVAMAAGIALAEGVRQTRWIRG